MQVGAPVDSLVRARSRRGRCSTPEPARSRGPTWRSCACRPRRWPDGRAPAPPVDPDRVASAGRLGRALAVGDRARCCWGSSTGCGGRRRRRRSRCAMPPDARRRRPGRHLVPRHDRAAGAPARSACARRPSASSRRPSCSSPLAAARSEPSAPRCWSAHRRGLLILAAIAWARRSRRDPTSAATLVERALPESRNVVFTARELLASPGDGRAVGPAPGRGRGRRHPRGQRDPSAMVPLRQGPGAAGRRGTVAAVGGHRAGAGRRRPPGQRRRRGRRAPPARRPASPTLRVTVTVIPPAYTGLGERRVTDPATLEVVAGSRIAVALDGGRRVVGPLRPARPARGRRPASGAPRLSPTESGYFAIERADGPARRG